VLTVKLMPRQQQIERIAHTASICLSNPYFGPLVFGPAPALAVLRHKALK